MPYGDTMMECDWKKHPYLKDTMVSKNGRVLSHRSGKWKELKPSKYGLGYLSVGIDNGNSHSSKIHRLVAETFIPNPNKYKYVNHKDGNKLNNCADNLEWCDHSHNIRHSYLSGFRSDNRKVQIIETGDIFMSETDCAKAIGGSQGHVSACLRGERKTHKGYHFKEVTE